MRWIRQHGELDVHLVKLIREEEVIAEYAWNARAYNRRLLGNRVEARRLSLTRIVAVEVVYFSRGCCCCCGGGGKQRLAIKIVSNHQRFANVNQFVVVLEPENKRVRI